jgi:Ni,Fe-hydrogenase III small subunit
VLNLWRKIRAIGRVAEPAPQRPAQRSPDRARELGGSGGPGSSVQLRHVDAGSCNGREVEIGSAFGPVYDAEHHGARLVASPRHADALLVTGPVTRNMEVALRRTVEAVPEPYTSGATGGCRSGHESSHEANSSGCATAVSQIGPQPAQHACPTRRYAWLAASTGGATLV